MHVLADFGRVSRDVSVAPWIIFSVYGVGVWRFEGFVSGWISEDFVVGKV